MKKNVAQPKTPVKFLHPWSSYNPGETAAFDRELADRLVKTEIAKPYSEKKVKFLKEHEIRGLGAPVTYEAGDVQAIDAELVPELLERKAAELHETKPALEVLEKPAGAPVKK